jgi:DNA polymerase III subunit beta
MRFTTDPRKLASAVSWAARRVPNRPDPPILGGMLIKLEDERLSFTGFDFEVSTTATLDPTDQPFVMGRCVVSGRLFAELVGSLPPKPVTVEANAEQMTLTCGPVRAALPLMTLEDYPALPTPPDPIGIVHAEDFAKQVARVLPAHDAAGTTGLPALTGMYLGLGGDQLSIAATNRYQMAVSTIPGWRCVNDEAEARQLLIPGEVVASVLKVCDYDGALHIGVTDNAVSFVTESRTTVSRLLDVKGFPQFANAIPKRAETPTVIQVEDVREALKRATMVLDDSEPVSLSFASDILTMRAGSGRGQVTAELDCDHQGPDVELAVNPAYFTTAISAAGETAELSITGPHERILVTAPKDDAYAHVVMPIRRPL